ncbi:MAG: protein-disulfide reductase DsbD domain-containing protein [Planctomycetota bacterium]
MAVLLLWTTVAAQQPLATAGIPADAPFSIWASASSDSLTLDVRMKPGWHMYAADVGGGQPVSVKLEPRSDFIARGALVVPAGKDGKLEGAFRLVLPLKKKGGGHAIAGRFEFMACDPLLCLPPMSVRISGELRRLKVLLVVDKQDARSKRITDLLQRSGMAPKVTTYAKVTTRACDKHDVVLADSKLFRKNEKGSVGRARAFPETSSPIVAVGFLGTELIEGQKIAMTSGYI